MLHPDQINSLYEILGNRIKKRREQANYKQTQFAQLLKISRTSLVNIEKGRQRAPLHIIYEIARLLKIEINELLPELERVLHSEIKQEIAEKIKEKSAGNKELHTKLMQFVVNHSSSIKK